MPLLKDKTSRKSLLDKCGPDTTCVDNLIDEAVGAKLHGVWVDSPDRPTAAVYRSHYAYLRAQTKAAAAVAVRDAKGRGAPVECNVPRSLWSVMEDAGLPQYGKVYLYTQDKRPNGVDIPRLGALKPSDASAVCLHHTEFPIDRDYVENQIDIAPSCAVRQAGELVAWAMTHDCGAMGALYVHDKYHNKGLGTAITLTLAERLRRVGVAPFAFVAVKNSASIGILEKSGFKRRGLYAWYGLPMSAQGRKK